MRKGIILAGGSGSRLYPSTKSISKQLLPIYDKPLVYYPLSTLMLADIKEILLITSPDQLNLFQKLLGDGSAFGISLQYAVQEKPNGLAESLIIAENFLNGSPSTLILGDNIFYGAGLEESLLKVSASDGATVFSYRVNDPERFGVAEYDENMKILSIEEKPKSPKSNYAITGIYFYDEYASDYAKSLLPSDRGELEITDLNKVYLDKGILKNHPLSRGYAWFDTGTPKAMLDASNFISTVEIRQGIKICCPEEIALNKGYLNKQSMILELEGSKDEYSKYILSLL